MQTLQTHTHRLELGQWALTAVPNEQFDFGRTIRRAPYDVAYRVHTLRKRRAAASSVIPAVVREKPPFAVVVHEVVGNAAYKRTSFILRQPDARSGWKKCSHISLRRESSNSPPQVVRRYLHILSHYKTNFAHLFIPTQSIPDALKMNESEFSIIQARIHDPVWNAVFGSIRRHI